jgi:hypothetical protein
MSHHAPVSDCSTAIMNSKNELNVGAFVHINIRNDIPWVFIGETEGAGMFDIMHLNQIGQQGCIQIRLLVSTSDLQ